MNKNGWRAGGNNTTGVTLELKIKDASKGLSKKKMYSCSGCVAAKRRNVSRVKRPIPSSWFFNKKRVLTAIFNDDFYEFCLAMCIVPRILRIDEFYEFMC